MTKQNNIDSRSQFIEQVAETIQSNMDGNQGEAFIFGLSGKWGEGKTTFLTSLSEKLDKNAKIINVNPWKYAEDRISFLRAFLKELNDTLPYSPFFEERFPSLNHSRIWVHRHITKAWRRRKLRPLYDDTSRKRVRFLWVFIAVGLIGLVMYLGNKLVLSNPDYKAWVMANKWYITALLLPIIIAVGQALVVDEKSHHTISATDEFESLLNKIIRKFKKRTRLIVYVDDLDRVTGKRAVEVLDNLRTFFDRPNIAFIVAGDHTVIERHLGRQLVPESDVSTQKDEGRRFLKKIFNVYWRLPLPTSPEMDIYIDDLFNDSDDQAYAISKIIKTKSDRETFARQLKTYFAYNFRNVARFVERVDFTFKVINAQINNKELSNDKKQYFREMLKNPLLVIRVLLLEEVANTFYEKVLHDPNLFIQLEVIVAKSRPEALSERLQKFKDILNEEQLTNLNKLLNENPRFYNHLGTTVMSPIPYLLLSSDSSFGDERGLSPKDFVSRVETASSGLDYATEAQVSEIKDVLEQSGDKKAREAANALLTDVNSRTGQHMSLDMSTNLFRALVGVEPKFTVHKIFFDVFAPGMVATIINSLNDQERKIRVILAYTDWLQTMGINDADLNVISDTLSEQDIQYFNDTTYSYNATKIITGWFVKNFPSSPRPSLNAISSVQGALNTDVLGAILPEIESPIIQNLVAEKTSSHGQTLLDLLQRFVPDGVANLKEEVKTAILREDESTWSWVNADLVPAGLYTPDELDGILLELIKTSSDTASLQRILTFLANKLTISDSMWTYILHERPQDLLAIIPTLFGRTGLETISPDESNAGLLFNLLYKHRKNQADEYNFLRYIRKDQWYFSRLNRIPDKRSLSSRARQLKNNPSVVNELSRILAEWSS